MPKPVKTKIGPNMPCPCGSGKKFKRCCKDKNRWESFIPKLMAYINLLVSGQSEGLRIFGLLVAADLVFIILHVLCSYTTYLSSSMFLITTDGGYAELFQYIKEFWIVLLLGLAAIRARSFSLFIWAMIFVYILMDDALRLHETIGGRLIGNGYLTDLQMDFGIAPYDLGQVLYAAFLGCLGVAIFVVIQNFSRSFVRQISRQLFILLCVFAFFSVVIDAVYAAVHVKWLGIIEDGGEHIVVSCMVWAVFSLRVKRDQ